MHSRSSNPGAGPLSELAYARAREVFPSGITRISIDRDPIPRYAARGEGAYLIDVDGRRFLDLNANFTTLIHGHAFEPVLTAIDAQLRKGLCFSNPTESEIALGALLCERIPHLDRIRFVSTGSEAVLFAVKAARAFTGRSAIAKIEGAYHGAYDWAEVSYASTPENWGTSAAPTSTPHYRGTPPSVLDEVVTLRFNDAEGVRRQIAARAHELAAILIDPMPSRAGLIPPEAGFVAALTEVAHRYQILIISDEVLNLRQAYRGASARYGLVPDVFALGKIIGGGLAIGAVGGRADVMKVFAADGAYPLLPQGGTFAANPLSMAAGLASMQALDEAAFSHLEKLGEELRSNLRAAIAHAQAPLSITGAASLFRIHTTPTPPREFRDLNTSPAAAQVQRALTRHFAAHGIQIPNAAAACLSTPMTRADIHLITAAFEEFLSREAALIERLR